MYYKLQKAKISTKFINVINSMYANVVHPGRPNTSGNSFSANNESSVANRYRTNTGVSSIQANASSLSSANNVNPVNTGMPHVTNL